MLNKILKIVATFFTDQTNLISNIGIKEGLPVQVEKKIKVTNLLVVAACILCFIMAIMMMVKGFLMSALLIFISNSVLLFTCYLNGIGKYIWARIWMMIIANLVIFPHALIFGQESGIIYIYLTLACVPLMIFELKFIKNAISLALFSMSLFFSLLVLYESNVLHTTLQQSDFFIPILSLTVLMHLVNLYYLIKVNKNVDYALERLKRQAENQIINANSIITNEEALNESISISTVLQNQIEKLEISKKELVESNIQITKLNNSMDSFIYSTSHDLKYPFTNIEALIDMIKINPSYENEEIKEVVDMMSLSVVKFKDTVHSLTKINLYSDAQSIYADQVNMHKLGEELMINLQSQIKEAKAQLIFNFEEAPTLLFSKKNMRSILMNMVGNAIKYRDPSRCPIVKVTTNKMDDFFILEISDNGLGIPPLSKNKIFSLFHRAHSHVEGSGIGLYIVNRIIENNGGKIELESSEGIGTTFRIFINLNH